MIKFMLDNSIFGDTQKETIERMIAENKPVGFCFDKDGNFYKFTKGELGITVAKADPSILAGEDAETVKEGFHFTLPKIPLKILSQIISFFRDICDESGDEVFARIYYDKETGEYFPYVPEQKISKANVTYNITDERFQTEDRYLFILDIHSHNTMGAFFSGTDNSDERTIGKVFMVIGQLDKPCPAYKIRTYQQPNHVEIALFDAFEKPEAVKMVAHTEYGDFTYEVPDEEIISRILVKEEEYPEDWKNQITKAATYYSGSSYIGGFSSGYSQRSFDFGRSTPSGQISIFGDDETPIRDFSKPTFKSHFKPAPMNLDEADIEEDIAEEVVFDENELEEVLDDALEGMTSEEFEELGAEEKYHFVKYKIAPIIASVLTHSVDDLADEAVVEGLKSGLEEEGLGYIF